jgi:hypothetical protein
MGWAPTGRREIIHCIYRVRGLRKAELKWLGYPAVCFMMWRFPLPPSINTYDTYILGRVGGCLVWGYLFAAHCFWAVPVCAVYNYASSFNTRVARGARSSTDSGCSTAWSHGSDNNFDCSWLGVLNPGRVLRWFSFHPSGCARQPESVPVPRYYTVPRIVSESLFAPQLCCGRLRDTYTDTDTDNTHSLGG